MVAALLGLSRRTFQRAEEAGQASPVVIRAIEMCYACEAVSPAIIVGSHGALAWRNGLAAAIGVGDIGQKLFGGFFSSLDGQRILSPAERVTEIIKGTLPPTGNTKAAYVWRADGAGPIYRIRYLDLGIVFECGGADRKRYFYSTFTAEQVRSIGS
jgi:hypothetical protein